MKNIILLHGAIGSHEQLNPLVHELKQLGYNVFSFSFSGHGESPFQKEFSIPQFAKELLEFINHNKLQKVDVFGYSMGGYVALYLSTLHPNTIGKIITLGTKFTWDPLIAQNEIKQLQPELIKLKIPKFAQALEQRHGKDWETLLSHTSKLMIGLGDSNLLNADTFQKIKNKVYIGLANNDTMVSDGETQLVADAIVNSERFWVQEAKHPIETVNPVDLANVINQFLNAS